MFNEYPFPWSFVNLFGRFIHLTFFLISPILTFALIYPFIFVQLPICSFLFLLLLFLHPVSALRALRALRARVLSLSLSSFSICAVPYLRRPLFAPSLICAVPYLRRPLFAPSLISPRPPVQHAEEQAHLAGLVLLFQKRGFPLVSLLQGGFTAARTLLFEAVRLLWLFCLGAGAGV